VQACLTRYLLVTPTALPPAALSGMLNQSHSPGTKVTMGDRWEGGGRGVTMLKRTSVRLAMSHISRI